METVMTQEPRVLINRAGLKQVASMEIAQMKKSRTRNASQSYFTSWKSTAKRYTRTKLRSGRSKKRFIRQSAQELQVKEVLMVPRKLSATKMPKTTQQFEKTHSVDYFECEKPDICLAVGLRAARKSFRGRMRKRNGKYKITRRKISDCMICF